MFLIGLYHTNSLKNSKELQGGPSDEEPRGELPRFGKSLAARANAQCAALASVDHPATSFESSHCLKVTQNVSFWCIASKANYIYFLNVRIDLCPFKCEKSNIWKIRETNIVLAGKFKWDIFGGFCTLCRAVCRRRLTSSMPWKVSILGDEHFSLNWGKGSGIWHL